MRSTKRFLLLFIVTLFFCNENIFSQPEKYGDFSLDKNDKENHMFRKYLDKSAPIDTIFKYIEMEHEVHDFSEKLMDSLNVLRKSLNANILSYDSIAFELSYIHAEYLKHYRLLRNIRYEDRKYINPHEEDKPNPVTGTELYTSTDKISPRYEYIIDKYFENIPMKASFSECISLRSLLIKSRLSPESIQYAVFGVMLGLRESKKHFPIITKKIFTGFGVHYFLEEHEDKESYWLVVVMTFSKYDDSEIIK